MVMINAISRFTLPVSAILTVTVITITVLETKGITEFGCNPKQLIKGTMILVLLSAIIEFYKEFKRENI